MGTPATLKKNWVITQEAFDLLLAFFDVDRERAAVKYEDLRRKLIKYLKYWGSPRPEDHADEAINRCARKFAEGTQLDPNNYVGFFCRVARNVLHEQWERTEGESISIHTLPCFAQPAYDPQEAQQKEQERIDQEAAQQCLQTCLRALSAEERELIRVYYEKADKGMIQSRQALAARLGITLNALRIKTCRVRSRLEKCVDRCLNKQLE